MFEPQKTYRILAVDDEEDILASYRRILSQQEGDQQVSSRAAELQRSLFPEDSPATEESINCHLTCCSQGEEAIAAVRQSLENDTPFCAIFMDIRTPPGMDGVAAATQIRTLDPTVNIVFVTAFADISPSEITDKIPPPEHLLYMQKPFHSHEIRQFVRALGAKWQAERMLASQNILLDLGIKEKTRELALTVEALEVSNRRYRDLNDSLQEAEEALKKRADDLKGAKTALRQLTEQQELERKRLAEKIHFTMGEMVDPYLDTLEKSGLSDSQKSFLKLARANLREITTPFMKGLSRKYFRLSPIEIQLANLIKRGKTSKEISEILHLTKRNVEFHRDRIREKIGIKNTKANLKNVLKEIELEFT